MRLPTTGTAIMKNRRFKFADDKEVGIEAGFRTSVSPAVNEDISQIGLYYCQTCYSIPKNPRYRFEYKIQT